MGYMRAAEMIAFAGRDAALQDHLQCNLYPPVTLAVVPYAEEAIDRCRDGEWDAEITFPNGTVQTAAQVVEGLRLEAFLNAEEESEED